VALRLALLPTLVVALALPSTLQAERAVVGGTPLDIRDAPWTVLVRSYVTETSGVTCSGTVLDATHVVTAAHCVDVGPQGRVAATAIVIRAGVTDALAPRPTDALQERSGAAYRIHPGFHWKTAGSPDDVAVIEVSAPFDLESPVVDPIALPATGIQTPGTAANFAGYGLTARRVPPSYSLVGMQSVVTTCKSVAPAVVFCARSTAASMCPGDSGGALVSRSTGTATLLGVGSIASCMPGTNGMFADVRAPEILQFILGDDDPPVAPREVKAPRLSYSPPLRVAKWIQCAPGTWTGVPTFVYAFRDEKGRGLKTSSSPRYRVRASDVSHRIHCHLTATNTGGTATEDTAPAPKVKSG
jgi:Trypsin